MEVKGIDEIKHAIWKVAVEYPLKKVKLFGSYANNIANENSDIDLLVEFSSNDVTLLTLASLKYRLEDLLGINVDVIEMPVPEGSILQIGRTIDFFSEDNTL